MNLLPRNRWWLDPRPAWIHDAKDLLNLVDSALLVVTWSVFVVRVSPDDCCRLPLDHFLDGEVMLCDPDKACLGDVT